MFSVKSVGFALCLGTVMTAAYGAERQVSFKQEVMPILQQHCVQCHGPGGKGQTQSGLLLDSYQHLMKGTKYGPVVVPGNSLSSVFNQVVEGRVDKSIAMPHGGEALPEATIKVLKHWVDQGAKDN